MCALSPVAAALLGHTTRPEETAETMSPFLMAGQLAEPALSQVEGLIQASPISESIRPWDWAASDWKDQEGLPVDMFFWKLFDSQ
ncbi:hypothetical protein [Nitrospira sp. Ecomares 2.1]